MLKRAVALTALALTAVAPAAAPIAAQEPAPPIAREFPATISGSASSEVKFVPDRATIRISVQTRATSAAEAASQNARKQNAVLSALRSLGMSNEQLSTADYSVSPEYRYEPNKSPILVGYTVTNSIVADVRDVAQIGKVLDAALANGANMVSSLEFYSSNTDAARRQAVASAVAKAKAEADVAARAAGGTLGTLMQLNISGGAYPPPPRPMMASNFAGKSAEATPINPGEQTITVSVTASWHFMAAK
jgi:uncharacterized protein YggE